MRYDAAAALKLLKGIRTIIAARGKSIQTLHLKDRSSDEEILTLLLGPTGNLRGPTARVGSTLLVGFNPEVDKQVFDQA